MLAIGLRELITRPDRLSDAGGRYVTTGERWLGADTSGLVGCIRVALGLRSAGARTVVTPRLELLMLRATGSALLSR